MSHNEPQPEPAPMASDRTATFPVQPRRLDREKTLMGPRASLPRDRNEVQQ